jgi:outer membrane protein assembly factor BamB
VLFLGTSLSAADWPQFLGPNRDNSTPEVVAPWTGDLKPLWKKPVGEGHSSPVVANGLVYVFYQPKKGDSDELASFDAMTGELKWATNYDRKPFKPLFGNGPRSTPLVSGDMIYTFGGTGVMAGWNLKTGDVAWKVDTLTEFKTTNLRFGISTSPIMAGPDKVVVMVGGKGAGVVAFDAKTGKTAWHATDDPASYSSPVLADNQLVFLTGANLLGLSLSGEKLWAFPFKDSLNESSTTPVVLGDLVIGSSITAGTVELKLTGAGGKFNAVKVWDQKNLNCYFSTPVTVGEHLYMINSSGSFTNPTIVLRCVEIKSGNVLWEKKDVGKYHAAILRCGPAGKEHLLMLDDNGFLTLFEPNPKEFKQLARSKVCGKTWDHPALVNGRLYLRDEQELICVPLK